MNIYSISADFDNFLYLIQEKESDYIDILDKEGQEIHKWKEPTQIIYKKKKKDSKGIRKDFNASAYFSGILLMEEQLANKMVADFKLSAQLLPIKTPELEEKFVFVNILGGIPAILECFYYDEDELWRAEHMPKMLTQPVFPELHGKYAFDKAILEQNPIFRDAKMKSFYFCTDVFVQWAKENNIKGLRFDNAGIIRK